MQTRKASSRAGGVGTTLSLLFLGTLLSIAALLFCLNHLRPEIESDIKTRVVSALDSTGLNESNVSVEGLDVTLTGDISSEPTRLEMGMLTSGVAGVARVYNKLTVGGLSATDSDPTGIAQSISGESDNGQTADRIESSDAVVIPPPVVEPPMIIEPQPEASDSAQNTELVQALQAQQAQTIEQPSLQLNVSEEGTVAVQGIVSDQETIEQIIDAVSDKYGTSNVNNQMSVFRNTAAPIWLDSTLSLIDQLDGIENAGLKITADELIMSGTVSSETLGDQKVALGRRVVGDSLTVSGDFAIAGATAARSAPVFNQSRTPAKRPTSLKITRDAGEIRVTGSRRHYR